MKQTKLCCLQAQVSRLPLNWTFAHFQPADGGIRLFRKYATPEVELVTAFRALSDLARSTRQEAGVISEWQQSRGQLLVGGNSKTIRVWDASKDACALVRIL